MSGEFYHWGPLLYRNKISKELKQEMLDRGSKSKLDFRSRLAGHLEKEFEYTLDDKIFFAKSIEPIMSDYNNAYKNYYGLEKNKDKLFQLEDLWINYMHPGDFNPPHIHIDTLSFVVYLQIPEEIKKEYNQFKELSGEGNGPGAIYFLYGQMQEGFINSRYFLPEEGDFFIFPAGLYHSVPPFKSNVVRISLAGNFTILDTFNKTISR